MPEEAEPYDNPIDFAEALGSEASYSNQCFAIYVPNKDRLGSEIGNQRKWVLEAVGLLTEINGGATAMPPAEGAWRDEADGIVWENPVVVYSYIQFDEFAANFGRLREFLHRMGRETNQGEVVCEFDNQFHRI